MLYNTAERGQGLVEYSMILLLIALVVIAGLVAFGQALLAYYQMIVDKLPF